MTWTLCRNPDGTWRLTAQRGRFLRGFPRLTDADLDGLEVVLRRGRLLGPAPLARDTPPRKETPPCSD